MKATISVLGRFHAFYLAAQLAKRGGLHRLLTSYPAWEAEKYGVPREKIQSLLWQEIVKRAWERFPRRLRPDWNLQFYWMERYDRRATRAFDSTADLFVGWNGTSLYQMQRARAAGIPTVVVRGNAHMLAQIELLTEEFERFGPAPKYHPRTIEKSVAEYEEADYIQILSSFARRTFIEHGVPEEKLIQVPLGSSLDEFSPVPKEDDTFRVMHCGRVSIQKGVHYLLEAWSALKLKNAELWLVGPVDEEIRPFLERHAAPSVIVHGAKRQSELAWFYSQCNVFCLASIQDGFGVVLGQAMACGLPAIATTNSGGPDIVSEGADGFVVPIRDPDALGEKILWCYDNRDACAEMGNAARRKTVEQLRGWDAYGDRIYAAYERILASGRR